MVDLTSRQVQILRAVIEEYIETAEPVGSETLDKKYNLGVSPATIRNEMVYLTNQGYLKQPHVSAGRTPTPIAMRLYVRDLMKKKDLSVADEVSLKERVWEKRRELDDLLLAAARTLAERSNAIGVAATQDHKVYHAGYSHILNEPEFFDINVTRSVLSLLEETRQLERIFFGHAEEEGVIHMVFGDELGNEHLEGVGVLFMDFICNDTRCSLGVIGTQRFNYPYLVPVMEYFRKVVVGFSQGR